MVQLYKPDANAFDMIDQEAKQAAERASAPRANGKVALMLFMGEDQRAHLRPLFDILKSPTFPKHFLWNNETRKAEVDAICASVLGQPCKYCEMAKTNKLLTPNASVFWPVYVYSLMHERTGQPVTYEKKNEDGTTSINEVKGIKLLELQRMGAIGTVLTTLRDLRKQLPNGEKFLDLEFTLTQTGKGKGNKRMSIIHKLDSRPMNDRMRAIIPDGETLCNKILEALPPYALIDISAPLQEFDNPHLNPPLNSPIGELRNMPDLPSSEEDDPIGEW